MKRLLWKLMRSAWLVRLATASPRLYTGAIASFERAPPVPGAVVFIGSSSIRFWTTLAEDFAPRAVVNCGFGGAHASHVLLFWKRVVPRHQPSAVVFYAGDNDLAAGKSVEQTLGDVRAFVEQVRAELPHARLFLLLVKRSPQRAQLNASVDALNAGLRQLAGPGVAVLDVDAPLRGPDGQPLESCFGFDGLHLSPSGYAAWTAVVKPALNRSE
jgi:lysophospholipase L1-like esterase